MESSTTLYWLMQWYALQCDGEWEHEYGPDISTTGNPGWILKIPLEGTECHERTFEKLVHNMNHDTEWWACWTENNAFHGTGGPFQLGKLIEIFREWTEADASVG